MTRALVIDDAARERAGAVVAYAREHIYDLKQPDQAAPGLNPDFVAHFEHGYRAVFSFTLSPEGKLFRHLSVSVDGPRYPSEMAMGEIAALFGFTGWDIGRAAAHGFAAYVIELGWIFALNEEDHCVIVVQPLEEDA